jgi:hypothetical protein
MEYQSVYLIFNGIYDGFTKKKPPVKHEAGANQLSAPTKYKVRALPECVLYKSPGECGALNTLIRLVCQVWGLGRATSSVEVC